ncbi:5'-nucleotidase C-terminal domain-containing protein [Salinimicrobium terrae]|uniref:5'-nucleotidase C-terminal domain-containing protein n=1 Tax=Salinimicrobium terrae TaxID=470866 RepID=UPI00048F834F|nr:5'-nucleotidase [Salinimicrobium terrae]
MKRYLLFLMLIAGSCKFSGDYTPTRIEGEQLEITSAIKANDSLERFIEPYKTNIDREMEQVLAYVPYNLTKNDGELNTAIGNLMADALMELSAPVFKSRTGENIDIVLLNFGGIRSSITMGNVTTRTAFQVMPFENEIVVATLKGEAIRDMIHYLIDSGNAHPVAGIELQLEQDNSIKKVLIQGEPLQESATYNVATSDYLLQGGDNMVFFSKAQKVTNLDYKIRNLLIDYFKQEDTLTPVRDERFIRFK